MKEGGKEKVTRTGSTFLASSLFTAADARFPYNGWIDVCMYLLSCFALLTCLGT